MSKKPPPRLHNAGPETVSPARLRAVAAVMRRQSRDEVLSDVNGSYTGTPVDYEKPVQDADDL